MHTSTRILPLVMVLILAVLALECRRRADLHNDTHLRCGLSFVFLVTYLLDTGRQIVPVECECSRFTLVTKY
ncbi:hypothetical protein DFJ58DRAFT_768826 [Suillus subalutaceus]|uniref:uncharacterized protein n=1 Tax=Suillus subalutaceus TaxID=48586 RepID=UPI001B86EEBA|nr:uncharacterized protein DFJ58DRAFT_768826 [Suillus subalutaceus]KAG1867175.1 hypothetical protein DFJ58DRAFT_768826 [Suillus subalutaceus]